MDFSLLIGAAVFAAVLLFVTGMKRVRVYSSWMEARQRSYNTEDEKPPVTGLQKKAAQAGLDIPTSHLVAAAAVGGIGAAVAVGAVTGKPLLALAGLLGGLYAPQAWVNRRIQGRAALFEAQLEVVLGQLSASLRAGQSVPQAFEQAAIAAAPPARDVFGRIVHFMRSGDTTVKAIEKAAQTVKSRDLEVMAASIGLHMQAGGDLALIFDQIADSIRDRRSFRAQVGSVTSEGRMTTNILALLPFIAVGGMRILQPDYMAPLFNTSTGLVLLVVCSGLIFIGWGIIKKIVSIEY